MDVVGQGILKLIFKFHNLFILPRIIKMADRVIVTSLDYAQNSNLALFVKKNPAKFIEVPNGVQTRVFSPGPKPAELIQRHGIDLADKIILFVGGLDQAHYFKGVEYLIEACGQLRSADYAFKLLIVGSGELQKDYLDLAVQLKLNFNVIFAGYVPNNDLPKYYNLADVVVLPSVDKSEAFGLTLVEGLACAKPVVASDLIGVRSVVTDGVDGYLAQPKSANDLATKINLILSNEMLAADFGKSGRRKVLLKYDWRVIGRSLDELYKKL
jgi:glycosyltransferase involved in cell wall biosynthesis